jgi:hypothetical protein
VDCAQLQLDFIRSEEFVAITEVARRCVDVKKTSLFQYLGEAELIRLTCLDVAGGPR